MATNTRSNEIKYNTISLIVTHSKCFNTQVYDTEATSSVKTETPHKSEKKTSPKHKRSGKAKGTKLKKPLKSVSKEKTDDTDVNEKSAKGIDILTNLYQIDLAGKYLNLVSFVLPFS